MRKKYFDKIPINKLVEPNLIIQSIGFTFIILGILFLFGWAQINSVFILAVAISGALFVLGDILQYKIEKSSENKKKRSKILAIKTIVLFFSIFSLLALPYISININDELLDKLATVASIIAIGLTILNIGLSNEKVQSDIFDAYLDILINIDKKIDGASKTSNEEEISLESDKETK